MSKKIKAAMDSFLGKNSDLEERYGVDPVRFARNDGSVKQGNTMDEYKEKMTEAARNDPDTRRTLEAAAMSGKGKASKILDKGFKSVDDVRNAQNFFEKAAKRHGQGGDFSSASDYMGLTQSMVERDRRKQDEGYDKKFASKEFLDQKLKDLQKTKDSNAGETPEYEESEEYTAAKERLSNGTYDTSSSIFKAGAPTEAPTTAFRQANEPAMKSDDRSKATNSYLEQYKEDVIRGGRIGEARSANIQNAFNTVIGSDI